MVRGYLFFDDIVGYIHFWEVLYHEEIDFSFGSPGRVSGGVLWVLFLECFPACLIEQFHGFIGWLTIEVAGKDGWDLRDPVLHRAMPGLVSPEHLQCSDRCEWKQMCPVWPIPVAGGLLPARTGVQNLSGVGGARFQ